MERNTDWLSITHTPAGDQTHSPGPCPVWESNQQPFTLQNNEQPTEPHQSGLDPAVRCWDSELLYSILNNAVSRQNLLQGTEFLGSYQWKYHDICQQIRFPS